MRKVQDIPFTGTFLVHGQALEDHTLYVARNPENTIVEIQLTADMWGHAGKIIDQFGFLIPHYGGEGQRRFIRGEW